MEWQSKKNNVVLSQYNFRRDIENRMLMAELSSFELEVLREILNGSLTFSLSDLADHVEASIKEVMPIVDKFCQTKLVRRVDKMVFVDKEMRKYYESEILKFDEDFEPNMEFLQSLLSKVPIHVLPTWYDLPNSTRHIFTAIVEYYLLTPKIYERYIHGLKFDDPVLKEIVSEVFSAPDFKVCTKHLMKKHELSRAQLEECMLLLEYNFVCCLGYHRVGEMWEEVVTPFHEWRTYLRTLKNSLPKPITASSHLDLNEFCFIDDMIQILKKSQEQSIVPINLKTFKCQSGANQFDNVLQTLAGLNLIRIQKNGFVATEKAMAWLKKSLPEKSLAVHRWFIDQTVSTTAYAERDIHEIGRALKPIVKLGWVYFDEFLLSMVVPLGNATPVTLQNKGKRWKYALPTYNESEKEFVENVVLKGLFQAGITAVGMHNGRLCFCVTPFGRTALGD